MKYELTQLEHLLSIQQLPAGGITMHKQAIRFEADRIMQSLALEAFTFQNEEHLQRYVQFHQHRIIYLIDNTKELPIGSCPNNTIQKEIYHTCLEEILTFIERYFSKYYDYDSKSPEFVTSAVRMEIIVNQKKLETALFDSSVDPHLADLMLRLMRKASDLKDTRKLTYREIEYLKELQRQLFRILENKSRTKDINEELRQILYYLNYNSVKVFTYHTLYIAGLLDRCETNAEKIEKLSFLQKKINQAQVKPGLYYYQQSPSLKDQLNGYITEELEYQKCTLQTSLTHKENQHEPTLEEFRIKFTASVAQIAYLLRILIGNKLILNNNLSQVFSFLVKYGCTKKSETISFGSLRSKYYTVESGTKEAVRSMLVSLIKHIDSD